MSKKSHFSKIDRIRSNLLTGLFYLQITNLDTINLSNVRVRVYTLILANILSLYFDLDVTSKGYAGLKKLLLTIKICYGTEFGVYRWILLIQSNLAFKLGIAYFGVLTKYQEVSPYQKFGQTNYQESTCRFSQKCQDYPLIL